MDKSTAWHPPLATRRQRKTTKRMLQRGMERVPGAASSGLAAHFLWHFLRWTLVHGEKCKRHVWVCPRCYDCLACLRVEACSCDLFAKAPGARCVVATSLPRVNDGA